MYLNTNASSAYLSIPPQRRGRSNLSFLDERPETLFSEKRTRFPECPDGLCESVLCLRTLSQTTFPRPPSFCHQQDEGCGRVSGRDGERFRARFSHVGYPASKIGIAVDNMLKRLMLPFQNHTPWRHRPVKETKGREATRPRGFEHIPSARVFHGFSSPKLDQRDREILSTVRGNPMTILRVSEKMHIPFVECLKRARKLLTLNLLERVDAEPEEVGLYRYAARERE